ncbi:MAG: DUF2807 domain-containing protein [Ferruginibacter sp.]|nr:DUF2807 domain-containing protein [Ferruginibacter sp.]
MKTKSKKQYRMIYKRIFTNVLLPLSVLLISMTAHSQEKAARKYERRKINIPENCRQVEVHGDVKLILTNALTNNLVLDGKIKNTASVRTICRDGKLIIDAGRYHRFSRLTVYLGVGDIRSIVLNGDTKVFSEGMVRTNDLEILLGGNASVSVNYAGTLKITPAEGIDMEYINYSQKKTTVVSPAADAD